MKMIFLNWLINYAQFYLKIFDFNQRNIIEKTYLKFHKMAIHLHNYLFIYPI